MAPVMRGLITYGELKSGRIFIEDIELMCQSIEISDENSRRLREAAQNARST